LVNISAVRVTCCTAESSRFTSVGDQTDKLEVGEFIPSLG